MSDYLRSINKTSNATCNKDIMILASILNYYYYFNELGNVVNRRMRMKLEDKKLNLLGNFKIVYDKNSVVLNSISFISPKMEIIVRGSFKCVNERITYHDHTQIVVSVVRN
jgi:hypothetical protein